MSFNEAGGAVATNKEQLMARRREGERAGVAKLEYARDLGSRGRETVRVRVPPSAPEMKRVGRKRCQSKAEAAMTQ